MNISDVYLFGRFRNMIVVHSMFDRCQPSSLFSVAAAAAHVRCWTHRFFISVFLLLTYLAAADGRLAARAIQKTRAPVEGRYR